MLEFFSESVLHVIAINPHIYSRYSHSGDMKEKYEEISRQNKPILCCVYLDGKVEHPYWGNVNSCNPVTAEQLSALT